MVAVYLAIQFVDNHFLIPRIVASKIKVNALVAIVGVLVGNAVGGRGRHVPGSARHRHPEDHFRPHREP
ncbi:MAG: hypothetical protein WKG07_39165 [Hymenobacter sp.]